MAQTLSELFEKGTLPHCALLIADPQETLNQVQLLTNHLRLNPADLLIVPFEQSIKIAQAREIRHFCQQTRFTSRIKLVVIPQADLLTPEAANALLKTLEEPPAHTHILLATLRPEILLPTIKSRCQNLDLPLTAYPIFTDPTTKSSLPPLPANDLITRLEETKILAAGEISLPILCYFWLEMATKQGKKSLIPVLLDYLPSAHTSVNRRLLLDNLVLDLYNAEYDECRI